MSSKLFRIVGPPGTGKTQSLASGIDGETDPHFTYVRRAVSLFGSDAVIVASLTKAAAAVAAGRDLLLPKNNVGTLHHHAYQAIGHPPLAEDKTHLAEWNEWVTKRAPDLQMTGGEGGSNDDLETMDEYHGKSDGDQTLEQANILRSRMMPQERWPEKPRRFWKLWSGWMSEGGYVDFTGMIEAALASEDVPRGIAALFVDEAQDSSRLEMALVRKWGEQCEIFVVAGDPDQNLFAFRGSDPEAFYDGEAAHTKILEHSHRVPRAVWDTATRWIEQCASRTPAPYYPRDFDGEVNHSPHSLRDAEGVVGLAEEYAALGKSVMVLASCSYMLDGIKHRLRDVGLPFQNEYRRRRADWNPLFATHGVASKDKLLAFLRPREDVWPGETRRWTPRDILLWSSQIKTTGVLVRGYKDRLATLPPDMPLRIEQWEAVFEHGGLAWDGLPVLVSTSEEAALAAYESRLGASKAAMAFPLRVAQARGAIVLRREPLITLGTIHSVKGGEAQAVILSPDLSPRGYAEWDAGGARKDAVIRTMYVGMTRASEELVLLAPSGPWAATWP